MYIRPAYDSSDLTSSFTYETIITQTVLSLSITSACIPCLKPFLDGFDTGMLDIAIRPTAGADSHSDSYAMTRMSKTTQSALQSRNDGDEYEQLGHSAAAFAVSSPGAAREIRPSAKVIHGMAIERTDQWDIRYEYTNQEKGSTSEASGDGISETVRS